jgi:hypothetical protein
MVDGDGTIGNSRAPYISLCGCRDLMEQFSSFLAEFVLDGWRQRVHTRADGLCLIQVEGITARKVAECLYSQHPVRLPRKAEKAAEA